MAHEQPTTAKVQGPAPRSAFVDKDARNNEILRLKESTELSQQDIARQIGVDGATVSRVIRRYASTQLVARKWLENRALELAERLVAKADAQTALKTLGKLDVVRDDQVASRGPGVVVVVGDVGHPLRAPGIDLPPVSVSKLR